MKKDTVEAATRRWKDASPEDIEKAEEIDAAIEEIRFMLLTATQEDLERMAPIMEAWGIETKAICKKYMDKSKMEKDTKTPAAQNKEDEG